jgi:hypothetical protein
MSRGSRNSLMQTDVGLVSSIRGTRPGAQELEVKLEGGEEHAVNYTQLLGEVQVGEQVLLNTTAVRAKLGTGGYHFVMKRAAGERQAEQVGRIVKLRYTPLQFRCRTVEEEGSPFRQAIESCDDLAGMPVIVAGLHSQIAPAAAGVKALSPESKVAYVMTDTAALPFAFSKLAAELRSAELIDAAITVGQAFGGDYEAVNIYTGLIAARAVVGADVAIVAQGPGNVGTETEWGFGGVAQGDHINAVGILAGTAIAVPRISFADSRERHRGVSRQSLVALGRVALAQAIVVVPTMDSDKLEFVHRQLDDAGITEQHEVLVAKGEAGIEALAQHGVKVTTMGRRVDEDPEFFLAAGAAGAVAVEAMKWTRNSERDS